MCIQVEETTPEAKSLANITKDKNGLTKENKCKRKNKNKKDGKSHKRHKLHDSNSKVKYILNTIISQKDLILIVIIIVYFNIEREEKNRCQFIGPQLPQT